MRHPSPAMATLLVVLAILLNACASTAPASKATVIRTAHDPSANGASFSNIPLIGVPGDYATRASFEDKLGKALANEELSVTPWYAVVGRRPLLTRDALMTAIRARNFDAVVLTRQKGQESGSGAPGRPVGSAFQLFEYDYPELNVASRIDKAQTIEFVTEVWRSNDLKKIWAIETLSFDKQSVNELIDEQSATIAEVLLGDNVVAN